MKPTDFLVWGVIAHIIIDWFFQNEWQAVNKTNWKHPAAWVHSGLHLIALLFVFPPIFAVCLAISHFLVDLRKPLVWWRKTIKQATDLGNPVTIHVAFWQDQCAHVLCLAIAAVLVCRQ